ncbi:hypothetical protein COT44_01910 [Candidatus Shapirobacteria bacterium CG08_land_8_20_14_0_20_39_18]|uniref:Uncharacterized protein n=1 Tax=Candidatus Shapirobacteria bacterium CG08_land_8_20_14_0_20_39_18 TaxID=1974883 RepID=A0A2M6XDF0_9BACT|nr:MAG: hypothetical protein COT44_01910 [Candidatus Shapirobacteria bacterium CG08_land_8_20_14_0_20_39_18]PIY64790.1 MAG: hypothetical protein COY91_04325 [Candidatus Shapirobacteria bacterium CG_4_10_14_0_8_um_filter_39_15]PJE67917.1 MAG: hypothetical protein COU94_04770 [Candidatus Shapirobacteria bacterium CG10_big_fil_rev_8_21_14_0_10_38_8]
MPILPEREHRPIPSESVLVVEAGGTISETQAEKEGLVQRVEEPVLEKPVIGQGGQVLVQPAPSPTSQIVLPISRQTYLNPKNWHKPVKLALTWLLRWIERLRKIYPGTTFQE